MAKIKSDIEIARKAKMKPINKILAKINVPDKSSAFSPMGRHIAKINFEFLNKLKILHQKSKSNSIKIRLVVMDLVLYFMVFSNFRRRDE